MKPTCVALSLAPVAGAARPCAAGAVGSAAVPFAGLGDWSTNSMTLKRNGYGHITARTRRPRRRPT